MNLFRKKSIHARFESDEESSGKKHSLNALQLTSLGIGAIIGAGIFVITGKAAAEFAGPALVLSFLIAAFICILTALCYAELSSMIPITGGVYSYTYVAMGEFPAWSVGWAATAQALSCCATVASGFSSYFVNILKDFGIFLPQAITTAPLGYSAEHGIYLTGAILNFPALLLTGGLGILIAIGVKSAARFNNFLVVLKLAVIFLFIGLGFFFIDTSNWHPFIPENTGIFGQYGWSGVIRGAGLVFFAFLGFETVATLSQEAKDVQKDVPRGIFGSLSISTFAYILTSLVLTGVVSYTALNVADPMAVALDALGPKFFFLSSLIKIAILAGLASVVLIMSLAQTRVFLAIAKDGLLPKLFTRINKKTQSPVANSLITAAIPMVAATLFPVEILAQLVSFAALFMFAFASATVLFLRYTHPHHDRPFKIPLGSFIPATALLSCVALMCFIPLFTWFQMAIWMAIGTLIYWKYGYRNSKLRS